MATIEIVMPHFDPRPDEDDLCPCMRDATPSVLFWFKDQGQPVTEGEPLVEVERALIVADVAAPATGTLVEIFTPSGDKAEQGMVIGRIEIEG